MKATDLLKHQHKEVEKLFAQLEKAEEPEKAAIRTKIADDLAAHATIEQEMFYPAARKALGDEPILRESLEEHGVIEFCLVKLLGAGAKRDADSFDAKATVLKESVMHHVGEEESELFKKVEKAMEKEQLEELGERMEARFEQCKAIGHKDLLAHDAAHWSLSPAGTPAGATGNHKTPAPKKRARPTSSGEAA